MNNIENKIKDVLSVDNVCYLKSSSKEDVLNEMIDLLADASEINNKKELTTAIFQREELMSTGIGLGIAIPHVRLDSVKKLVMAVGISKDGIDDYEALDDKPVHLVFMIAGRPGQHAQHLRLLSMISSRMKDQEIRDKLMAANTPEEFYEILVSV